MSGEIAIGEVVERTEEEKVNLGRELARRNQCEGLDKSLIMDILPEMPADEANRICDRLDHELETALRDEIEAWEDKADSAHHRNESTTNNGDN